MSRVTDTKKPDHVDYWRFLQRQRTDIQEIIEDLEFIDGGGSIIRAVDFSEINAFVLPGFQGQVFPIVSGLLDTEQVALDLSTLSLIFFGTGSPSHSSVVLLPPHRVELRNAQPFFETAALAHFFELTKSAEDEVKRLTADREFAELLARMDSAIQHEEKRKITETVVGYLREHASILLLAVMKEDSYSPQMRLRKLLERADFVDLASEGILGRFLTVGELDDKFVSNLNIAIRNKRLASLASRTRSKKTNNVELGKGWRRGKPHSVSKARKVDEEHIELTSYRDALAVGYLVRINELLATQKKPRRMVLVTRSTAVLTAVEEYARASHHDIVTKYIRRPSVYSTLLLQPGASIPDRLAALRQRKRALTLTQKFESREKGTPNVSGPDPEVSSRVKELEALWRSAVNLSIAAEWRAYGADELDNVPNIIRRLMSSNSVQKFVSQWAAKLATDISFNNAAIAHLNMGSVPQSKVGTQVELDRPGMPRRRPVFVWSRNTPTTIGLYFYNRKVRALGLSNQSKAAVTILRRFLNAGRSGIQAQGAHWRREESFLVEACLALSFLEAMSFRWDFAEMYADLAVNWSLEEDPAPRHESYYMRAVTRRRAHGPVPEFLRRSLEDLEQANLDIKKHLKRPNDPRYVFEEGVQYYGLYECQIGGGAEEGLPQNGARDPSIAVGNDHYNAAIRRFEQAKTILDDQVNVNKSGSLARQRLDVVNALCYARVNAGQRDDDTFRLVIELSSAIRACGWTESTVPLTKLDTLCWGLFWFMDRFVESDPLTKVVQVLAARLKRYEGPSLDKMAMQRHISIIGPKLRLRLTD